MRLYLDTNIFIYTVEKSESCKSSLKELSQFIDDNQAELVTSEITIAECLNLPKRHNNKPLIALYLEMLEERNDIQKISLSYPVIKLAIEIGARNKLKLIDALHAACAVYSRCDFFVTADKRIKTIDNILIRRFEVNFDEDDK